MSERYVIADTHFGHTNTWEKFKRSDGSPLRPFTSTEEMDETIVERWNANVKPGDTVYHLGDVVIARRNLKTVKRLNGRKILIRGNHDLFKDNDYYEAGFHSLRGCHVCAGKWIMTHVPIHPESIARFRVNVHGHLHANRVLNADGSIDPRYYCVSVEHTNYEPISFDELEQRIQQQWDDLNYQPPADSGWGNRSNPL